MERTNFQGSVLCTNFVKIVDIRLGGKRESRNKGDHKDVGGGFKI